MGGVHNLPPSTCVSKLPHDAFTLCFIEHLASLGGFAVAALAGSVRIKSGGFAREVVTIPHPSHVSPNGFMIHYLGVAHIQGPRSVSPKSHIVHLLSVLSSIWPP